MEAGEDGLADIISDPNLDQVRARGLAILHKPSVPFRHGYKTRAILKEAYHGERSALRKPLAERRPFHPEDENLFRRKTLQ